MTDLKASLLAINTGESLEHHGIKGQKWGIRRFQNPDGSLTEEGKKRYGKTYLTSHAAYTDMTRIIQEDFPDKTNELSSKLNKNMDEGDSLSKDYEQYYSKIDSDPSFINAVKDRKNKYIQQGWEEEMAEDDAMDEVIKEYTPKDLVEKRKNFDNAMNSNWEDIKKYTDEMVDTYSSVFSKAKVPDGSYGFFKGKGYGHVSQDAIKDAVLSAAGDIKWYSYMSRHYDDYWVNDLDSRYALEDRIRKKLKDNSIREKHMAPAVKKAEEYVKAHPGTPMSVDYNAGTITLGPDTFKIG